MIRKWDNMIYESELRKVIQAQTYVDVKNLRGTDDSPLPKGSHSWKEYWEKEANKKFSVCSCKDCKNPATDGAHVKKVKGTDHRWFIVPLCHKCNTGNNDTFCVLKEDLVPVNK